MTGRPFDGLPVIPAGELRRADGRPNFDHIRRVYEVMLPELLASERWVDPYFLDWVSAFTPIEMAMWSLIRSQHIPYYPQLPVGRFFVDFGNPHKRIAIECDGKEWHDLKRDNARDAELMELGWRVARFSGYTCLRLPALPDLTTIHHNLSAADTQEWLASMLKDEADSEIGEWITEERGY